MQNNIFRKSSLERISSPEKLNDFIKVSNPAGWMVIGAALAIVLGLLCWGFFGQLNETAVFGGYLEGERLCCYAQGALAEQLKSGMEVTITPKGAGESFKGHILTVHEHPLSYDEAARDISSDYMRSSLGITNWNIPVILETDELLYDGIVYHVSVVTDTYRPIEMLFRRGEDS